MACLVQDLSHCLTCSTYSADAVDKEEWQLLLNAIATSKGAYKSPPIRTLAEQVHYPLPAP